MAASTPRSGYDETPKTAGNSSCSSYPPEADEKAPVSTAYDAEALSNSGYFNIHSGLKYAPPLLNPVTRYFFYPLVATIVLMRNAKSISNALGMLYEHARWSLSPNSSSQEVEGLSLRKTVTIVPSVHVSDELDKMLPLRKGR